jgi:signal transduction histidine kinase
MRKPSPDPSSSGVSQRTLRKIFDVLHPVRLYKHSEPDIILADLVDRLSSSTTVSAVLQAAREVLGDPGLELWFRSPMTGLLAPGSLPVRHEQGILFARTPEGDPFAAIISSAHRRYSSRFLVTAAATCGMALETIRVRNDAEVREKELQTLATRLAEAGFTERRRLERDLHDGAQQRLLGIKARLSAQRYRSTDKETAALIDEMSDRMREVLEDLRALTRGFSPGTLAYGGLLSAIEETTDNLQLDASINIPDTRFGDTIERTLYYVISEALANVVKHAQASHVDVRVYQQQDVIYATVTDDGIGGADYSGSGLQGLADRVRALGGDLSVGDRQGVGTLLEARIPCALE